MCVCVCVCVCVCESMHACVCEHVFMKKGRGEMGGGGERRS